MDFLSRLYRIDRLPMRMLFITVTLLLCILGCRPDPHVEGRKYRAEEIKKVQAGTCHSVHCPPVDLLRDAAEDPAFIQNLREISLDGKFDRYSEISLGSFVHLERVCLVDTKDTHSYLKVLPSNIKVFAFDRTDLTMWHKSTDPKFVQSWLKTLTRFSSLEELFINPWDNHMSSIAAEILPELQELKRLELEWADEKDVSILQEVLPDCHVSRITEH